MWRMIATAYRSVGVQVATHVLNLELELALAALLGTLRQFSILGP